MNKNMWMVRAGRGANLFEDFEEQGIVTIGWQIGDIKGLSREEVVNKVKEVYPEFKKLKAVVSGSQLFRFASEIQIGDFVVTYDSSRRVYLLGEFSSDYKYELGKMEEHPHFRFVNWKAKIDRDDISVPTKNTLGAISTLFKISDSGTEELIALSKGEKRVSVEEISDGEIETEEDIFEDIQSRSKEFIKDKLTSLEWDDMQDLIAGLLRAMGYKTRVSSVGPDRGKDIVASPDGFGFESPRIVVEVKHRPKEKMDAPLIRSFLGGRHKDDKGLYVSTGGFTKEAKYEAERAQIPLMLMDLDALVDSFIEYYEQMGSEVRALIPLTKIYWPA